MRSQGFPFAPHRVHPGLFSMAPSGSRDASAGFERFRGSTSLRSRSARPKISVRAALRDASAGGDAIPGFPLRSAPGPPWAILEGSLREPGRLGLFSMAPSGSHAGVRTFRFGATAQAMAFMRFRGTRRCCRARACRYTDNSVESYTVGGATAQVNHAVGAQRNRASGNGCDSGDRLAGGRNQAHGSA